MRRYHGQVSESFFRWVTYVRGFQASANAKVVSEQVAVNHSETYGAMVEGVEMVSRLVARFAKVEELYLQGVSAQREQLEQCIIELYVAILIYLLRAREYYNRTTAGDAVGLFLLGSCWHLRLGRITRSVVQSSASIEKFLKTISEKTGKVDEIARLVDADCRSSLPADTWLIKSSHAQNGEVYVWWVARTE
jgi:hypothetical protein